MATKKASFTPQPQDPLDFNAVMERLAAQAPAADPAAESRGAVRGAADLGLSFGRGAVQGVRMFTDLAGADNAVSGGLRTVEDFIGGLRSAQAKQDDQAIAAILKEAEGKGIADQVVAGFRAFAQAPGSTMAQALGTSVPTIAAALATGGAAPGAALAARAVPATVGALQGTGAVKGSIYDEVYRRALTEEGRSEEEARALAEQAQAYSGDNAGQLALGAGLGALAGGSGLERGVQALRGGVTTAAPGIARRVGMGALAEGIPEALQGGQEKYATNVAQDRAGFPTDPMAGVVASGTMEAIAGGAMGGAFGIPRPPQRPGDELRKDKLPENGPMTRALNQGVEAAAQAADRGAPIPPELTDAPGATPPPQGMEFEADPRFANAPTFGNGQAPAAQRFGTKLAADLFIGEQGLMGSHETVPVEGGFEVRPTAAPSVSMVSPGVYELPSAAPAPAPARVQRPTPAAPSAVEPAPVLQPEAAPEETSLSSDDSEPRGPVQPGDVTMKNGKPFTVKNNGLLRAFERRLGPGYVRTPVEGGIVLRKVGGDGPLAGDAQPGSADDGATDGNRVLPAAPEAGERPGVDTGPAVDDAVARDPAAQLQPGEPAAELTPAEAPAPAARTFDPAQPVSYGRFKTRGEVEAYRAMVVPQAATNPDMAEVLARVDEAIAKAEAPKDAAAPAPQAPPQGRAPEAAAPRALTQTDTRFNPDPDAERERGARERPAAQWAEQQAERLGLESISAGIGRAVGGLGDVIVDIKSAPGVLPVVAEVRAEYQGKKLESRGVEGDAAIKAAVDEYAGKIQQARERMAARVQADERGIPPAPAPQRLPPTEEADARPELGTRWDAMTPDERQAVAAKAGWATAKGGTNPQGRSIAKKPWAEQVAGTRKRLGDAMPAPAAPKPAPAPAPAPEPAPPPPAAEPAPAPEPPARTPEQARTIELKKRLKVLEALRRCVG